MASANELLALLDCTIRFNTREGEYEGVIRRVIPTAETVVVGKITLLPNCCLGSLNFGFSELSNIRVISRPDAVKEKNLKKEHDVPVYPKTEVEKLFDFDNGSDIEDGECDDHQTEAYEMKLVPHLAVPKDFDIIESFNREFNLAIKHIQKQDSIGVCLEGIQVSRSGTLTWLCISTKSCNFLFDILALGERAFQKGLKSILENDNITKIFHDCRLASDCLFHKYGVRLVNVFDTQVADFIVMMQMNPKEKIGNRVNTLDACLGYYLKVPYEHLYGEANLDDREDSPNFHAKRPLQHDIQDVLIKNVMYLHLLKGELELALMIPLRRATDVYLNCVQKLEKSELLVVPHQPNELPLDMHLDGIQIFRYKDFEYACSTVASGPPYRDINNPMKNYLNYQAAYKNGQTQDKKSVVHTFEKLCESDQDYSEDCKIYKYEDSPLLRTVTDRNVSTSQKNIMEAETSQCSDFSIRGDPMELLSEMAKETLNLKATSDDLSKCSSQVFSENFSVDNKLMMSNSSNTYKLPSFQSAFNFPVNNVIPQLETSLQPHQILGRKYPVELSELVSKMKSLYSASDASIKNPTNDISETSEVVGKTTSQASKEIISSAESVQVNNSVVNGDDDTSDSYLEEVAARVIARGALLRNLKTECSTSNPFRTVRIKHKETGGISLRTVETTSEDVILYHRDTLDKPSELVVTVNHKNKCLADLYREAGDHSMQLWNEDSSNSVPTLSPNRHNDPTYEDDFWSRVLGDRSSQPMDEKVRARLIPAGMSRQ